MKGKAAGAPIFYTTSILADGLARREAEIAALKPKDRKTWKSALVDSFGQKAIVRYSAESIETPRKIALVTLSKTLQVRSKGN